MLHLRVFGSEAPMIAAARSLGDVRGARHVTRVAAGDGTSRALVTADLQPDAVDPALAAMHALGVAAEDVSLLRLDSIQSGPLRRANLVVWADLLGQAGTNARPVARYLVFMAVAGVIAAYGVIYANGILIVGAMAVSPDLLPITSLCVALVLGRRGLLVRAFWTLGAGLGLAWVVAGVLTAVLDALGWLPSFDIDASVLSGLTSVNSATFLVALVAGVAGILSLETRASSAVGVAISVTTIPASAYLGVAAGLGEVGKASGALLVLTINVVALVVGGSLTLLVQRMLGAERSARDRGAAPAAPAPVPPGGA
jgi:uncharacterized hydrophobic protein (TIGR00271 family)